MKRYGQIIGVNPEVLEKYKEYHSHIWPEIAQNISECHIRNYSIFNLGDKLFAYFEYVGSDFENDMKHMSENKMTQKWWDIMKPMQIPLEERKEGEWWANMIEVFHQD